MSRKYLYLVTVLFFLSINFMSLLEEEIGGWFFLIALFLFGFYFLLIIILLIQINRAFQEKFKIKSRVLLVLLMLFVIISTFFKPTGLFNFEKFEEKNLLLAYNEGSANCSSTLKLKINNRFILRNVCFGVEKISGKYKIINDTVFFIKKNFTSML